MHRLYFSKSARANFLSIGRYTEQKWGKKQRDVYITKLFNGLDALGEAPESGKPRNELFAGMLCVRIEKHVVYYFFRKRKVLIVGILHERMDPSLHLTDWQ